MDIVDAQVHANVLGTEVTLAVMDALGIQGVLFDEYQTTAEDGATQPGTSVSPHLASSKHRDRHSGLPRITRNTLRPMPAFASQAPWSITPNSMNPLEPGPSRSQWVEKMD